jgi:DNA-binding NarL/FixJ family response regulator
MAAGDALSNLRTAVDRACNRMQPPATPRNPQQPHASACKTNPRPATPATSLSPQQRAAARLLAMGRTIPSVARELNLCRSTVWRWQRTPAFAAELERLHDYLAAAMVRTRGSQ